MSLGAERYRHIADDIYTLDVDDGAFNGLNLNKRDGNGNMIIHKGKVVRINNGLVSDLGYQMIVDANGHNKSMFAEPDAMVRAVETYITCGHEQECYEDGVLLKSVGNSSTNGLDKRDLSGAWASYNDWGYNGGFTHDWWYWDEFSKAARSMAYDTSLNFVQQVQPCTSSTHVMVIRRSGVRQVGYCLIEVKIQRSSVRFICWGLEE